MLPRRISPEAITLRSRLRAGDRAAFDSFYEEGFRRVFAYALRRTEDRVTAEWVTEATLVEALERLDDLHGEDVPALWLLEILKCKLAVACDPPSLAQRPARAGCVQGPSAWRRLGRWVARRRVREEPLL